jgi:midasin
VQILKFAVHLVEVHSKLGGADNGEVRRKLEGWTETFAKLDAAQDSLPRLPAGFGSAGGDKIQADVESELDELRNGLEVIAQARPDLTFVVQQIQLWTSIQTTEAINGISDGEDINGFAVAALTLSSKILVALQNFQKAAQSLPQTTEDAGWLIQYGDNLQQSIDALRMTRITEEVETLISQLKTHSANQPTAAALLRLIHPVLSQYSTACSQNLAQFSDLHRTTCRLGYHLAASFVQISSQGFCMPQEKSDEKAGESGNVESGTGLGDGEGAEDISKDIKADEDLSELAQDPNNKTQGDIEENEDAVDMGEDEMEGELGDVGGKDEEEEKDKDGKDGSDDEDEEDGMEEEAGDVDDLDPTAVDEKMWDGGDEEEAEKDQKGDKEQGKKDDDQSAAAEGEEKKEQQKGEDEEGNAPPDANEEQGDEDAEAEPGQEEEGMPQEELNRQDQNVENNETLALPEDMDIEIDDGEEQEDDNLDDLEELSDAEKPEEKQADATEEDMSQSGDEEERGEEEHQKDEDVLEEEAEQEEEIDAAGDREEEMDVDMQEEGE